MLIQNFKSRTFDHGPVSVLFNLLFDTCGLYIFYIFQNKNTSYLVLMTGVLNRRLSFSIFDLVHFQFFLKRFIVILSSSS